MQFVRTLLLLLLTIVLVAFIAINWQAVTVNLWPLQDGYLFVEWPVGFIVLVSFLAGVIPVWLLSRATRWRLNRRIASLENSLRANSVTPPLATSTQLDAATPTEPAPL